MRYVINVYLNVDLMAPISTCYSPSVWMVWIGSVKGSHQSIETATHVALEQHQAFPSCRCWRMFAFAAPLPLRILEESVVNAWPCWTSMRMCSKSHVVWSGGVGCIWGHDAGEMYRNVTSGLECLSNSYRILLTKTGLCQVSPESRSWVIWSSPSSLQSSTDPARDSWKIGNHQGGSSKKL